MTPTLCRQRLSQTMPAYRQENTDLADWAENTPDAQMVGTLTRWSAYGGFVGQPDTGEKE